MRILLARNHLGEVLELLQILNGPVYRLLADSVRGDIHRLCGYQTPAKSSYEIA